MKKVWNNPVIDELNIDKTECGDGGYKRPGGGYSGGGYPGGGYPGGGNQCGPSNNSNPYEFPHKKKRPGGGYPGCGSSEDDFS